MSDVASTSSTSSVQPRGKYHLDKNQHRIANASSEDEDDDEISDHETKSFSKTPAKKMSSPPRERDKRATKTRHPSSEMDTSASEDLDDDEQEEFVVHPKGKIIDINKRNKTRSDQDEDDEEDDEEENELLLPNTHTKSPPQKPQNVQTEISDQESRQKIRKLLLRPSPSELVRQQQQVVPPQEPLLKKETKEPSFNIKLLQSEISRMHLPQMNKDNQEHRSDDEKEKNSHHKKIQHENQETPKINDRSINPSIDRSIDRSIGRSIERKSFLHHYRYQTVTDNGTKWGSESRSQQPVLSRLYCIQEHLNPDSQVPSCHYPIVLGGDTFAQMEIRLSWFPIRNQMNQSVPFHALRGSTVLSVQCFPHVFKETQAHFTGDMDCVVPFKKINPSSKTCAISIQDQVIVSMRIFSNQKKILKISKDEKLNQASLFYLDFHVAHLKHDPNQYRLFWLADISVNAIKWVQ